MSSDVQQQVQTVFAVNSAAAIGNLNAIGAAASSVGQRILQATSAGMRMAGSLGAAITPLRALIGGALGVGGVRALVEMHSQAEGMRQSIAGTLTAFGATRNFSEGLQVTAGLMDQINRDAAALPGSAEDYAATFRTALPAAMSAGFRSLSDIANFTNHMTAVAVANQEDSQQAGMDMMRLLQGQAGAHVRLWHTLSPLIGKTAQEFNALTAPQRAQAMQGALARYAPLLAEMSNTWDAIYGTTQQYVVQLTRSATAPIFDSIKGAFSRLNEMIDDNHDAILRLGTAISTHVVNVFDPLDGRIAQMVHHLNLLGRIQGFGQNVYRHAAPIFANARDRIGQSSDGGQGMGLMSIAARLVFGPIGGVVAFFATHMSMLTGVLDALEPAVAPIITIFETAGAIVGDLFSTLVPPLAGLVTSLLPGFASLLESVHGPLDDLFQAAGHLVTALGPVLLTALDGLAPIVSALVVTLTDMVRAVTAVVEYFNRLAGSTNNVGTASMQGQVFWRDTNGVHAAPATPQPAPPINMQGHNLPNSRGGHHTVNDFRYSRFDITQRFAADMDPDRIAIAFTHSLERSADQRLQGQLEPHFTQR